MHRIVIAVLALLLAVSSASARGGRNPSSAKPPPIDWVAVRENGEKEIRALLVRWLEARKAILVQCGRCKGAGGHERPRRPGSFRACSLCGGCGLEVGQEFDPAAVDRPLFRPGDRSAYWARIRKGPTHARGIAIGEYQIREIRVLGDLAYAMVVVLPAPFRGAGREWGPDVTSWRRIHGKWTVMDPDGPPSIVEWGGGTALMPESLRPKPTQEAAALAALEAAGERLHPLPGNERAGLALRVRARGAGLDRELILTAEYTGSRFRVRRKQGVFGRGAGGAGRKVAELTRRLLDAVLSRDQPLLPPLAEYDLEMRGDAIVMRGFSPFRFLETVTVQLDPAGLPRSITREWPGRATVRTLPRFEELGGRFSLVGAMRTEGDDVLEFSVRWRKERGFWLPKEAEIRVPGGVLSLSFTRSWPRRREGL